MARRRRHRTASVVAWQPRPASSQEEQRCTATPTVAVAAQHDDQAAGWAEATDLFNDELVAFQDGPRRQQPVTHLIVGGHVGGHRTRAVAGDMTGGAACSTRRNCSSRIPCPVRNDEDSTAIPSSSPTPWIEKVCTVCHANTSRSVPVVQVEVHHQHPALESMGSRMRDRHRDVVDQAGQPARPGPRVVHSSAQVQAHTGALQREASRPMVLSRHDPRPPLPLRRFAGSARRRTSAARCPASRGLGQSAYAP
jgi:hypothetical protein